MSASAYDLVLVLTGGSSNNNPNLSLGGNPSSTPIMGVLNNLFDNITESEANVGQTDYRCIYLFNNNSTQAFYNVKLYLDAIVAGTNIKLGFNFTKESQRIIIYPQATSGFMVIKGPEPPGFISYPTVTEVSAAFNADPVVWANNIQTAINSMTSISLYPVTVAVGGNTVNRFFDINFNDYRNHDLFSIQPIGTSGSTIGGSVVKSISGSPINAIPPLLDASTTEPSSVIFSSPTSLLPTIIGTLHPEEGLPIWIKRTVLSNTLPSAGNGFTLKILASPISP